MYDAQVGRWMAVVSNGVPSRYTFNGKEAQEAFGMGWMDFGARMYDAQVGRWMAVDALAEVFPGWSGYKFGMNNPIMYIDTDGQIEIPLRATRLYNKHKLQRSSSGFLVKTNGAYVSASSHTVKATNSKHIIMLMFLLATTQCLPKIRQLRKKEC
jgi:RHS repeat-associated protein